MARSLVWGNGKGNGNRATRRRNNWTTGKRTLFARSKSLWIIARALSSATKERIDSWTRRDDWKINQTWKTQNHLDFFRRIFVCTYDLRFSLLVANGNEIGEHELETIIFATYHTRTRPESAQPSISNENRGRCWYFYSNNNDYADVGGGNHFSNQSLERYLSQKQELHHGHIDSRLRTLWWVWKFESVDFIDQDWTDFGLFPSPNRHTTTS